MAQRLLAAFVAEVASLYPGFSANAGPSATPADFSAPKGRFMVAWLDGQPVGCGGVKKLDAETAEMKRVYVAPEARSKGVANALVAALEDAGRALGFAKMRLDTGRSQPHARALYLKRGYREIADYNQNPFAGFWFEREL